MEDFFSRYDNDSMDVLFSIADSVLPGAPIEGCDLSALGLMKAAGYVVDDWQHEFLTAHEKLVLALATRQAGKTQCAAALFGSEAAQNPETNWIVASPSFLQSARILARIRNMWRRITAFYAGAFIPPPQIINRAPGLVIFDNGSQVIALPDNPVTIRGETAHGLLIEEAAYVSTAVREVVDFMLAATGGRTVEISSAGIIGSPMHAKWLDYEAESVRRIEVPWWRVPRISKEFVEEQRRTKSAVTFAREMECKWSARDGAMFREADIQAAVTTDTLLASDIIPGLEEVFA
jgi:Terminase large subunit, T4likevirus-type, N-terminal